MKREEILKQAIEKAVENGWMNGTIFDDMFIEKVECDVDKYGCGGCFSFDSPLTDLTELSYTNILFDIQFAKAFWGEVDYEYDENGRVCSCNNKGWCYHIQRLALAEDRLEYISKFI